jgi:hypothetical protein
MSLVPENLAKHSSPFLKGEDFDGEGQNLIIKGFSVITASNAEYGANKETAMYQQGKLQLGETFKYNFLTIDNEIDAVERTYESTSPGFFIAFNKLAPEGGEKVNIRREGKAAKTRYFITIIK